MKNLLSKLFFCFMMTGMVMVIPSCQQEVILSKSKMSEIAYSDEYKNFRKFLDIATGTMLSENLMKHGFKVGDQIMGKYITEIKSQSNMDQKKADQDMLDARKLVGLKFPEFEHSTLEQEIQISQLFRVKENTDAFSSVLVLDTVPPKTKD